MQTYSNSNPFTTHRKVKKDGKDFLVVKGAPIVEGVLNKFLVPMDEFGAFIKDWDGVRLVLRHPKENNGSARVPSPDVPVIGNFYGAMLDEANSRMIGEYWFDEGALLATNEGQGIIDSILAGQIVETSTGYYANLENTPGIHKGISYIGVQREIHPDHIAILPDEIGACSIRDGCGVNRNTSTVQNCEGCAMKKIQNMTGNLPAEGKKVYETVYKKAKDAGDDDETASKKAWGACKRAGWTKKGEEWVKKNYAIYENADNGMDSASQSMIAFMLPDDMREKIKADFPFITDEVYNSLHLTLAFLGDTGDMNIIKTLQSMFESAEYQPVVKGQVQGLARFISGGDQDAFVLTFDSPAMPELHRRLSQAMDWKGVTVPHDHGFIPHITLAYIGKDDELPVSTFEPFDLDITDMSLVNGDATFLKVPFYQGNEGESVHPNSQAPSHHWLVNAVTQINQKEKHTMDETKKLVQAILNAVGWTVQFDDAGKIASATPPTSAPLSPTLTGLESVVNSVGGADKFAELIANLQNIPALLETVNGLKTGTESAVRMAQNIQNAAEAEKKTVVARLVANQSCPLDEAQLNALDVDALRKLELSYMPTNYAALGAFVPNASAGGNTSDDVLAMPSYMSMADASKEN